MLHLLIYAVIGFVVVGGIGYLFVRLGNTDPDTVHMDEETLVRTYGDPTMVNLYYKAHTDDDRREIVNFICTSHGLDVPPPSPKKEESPIFEKRTVSPFQAKMDEILSKGEPAVSDGQLVKEMVNEDDDVLSFTQFEAVLEGKRAAQDEREEEIPTAPAAPVEEEEEDLSQNSFTVRSSEGKVETFKDLDTAIAAALAQMPSGGNNAPDIIQDIWADHTMVMEKPVKAEQPHVIISDPLPETEAVVEESAVVEEPVVEAAPVVEEPAVVEEPVVVEEPAVVEEPVVVVSVEEPVAAEEECSEGQNFCIYCGEALTPGFAFCMNCGQPVAAPEAEEEPAPAEGPVAEETPVVEEVPAVEEIPAEESAVVEEPVEEESSESQKFCIHCGAPLTPGFRFCMICGLPVDEEEPAQEEPAAVEEPAVEAEPVVTEAPAEKKADAFEIPQILSLEEILNTVREMDQEGK